MKKVFLRKVKVFASIFVILFASLSFKIYAQYPSDSAEIMLLTVSPGTEIYALYGHSAIRIYDTIKGIDIVYNFGIFDFDTPNFYLKFINGRLMYQLGETTFERFIYSYEHSGQAIYQQKLNLTNHEKWQLITNLEINYQPENRYYRYDFFHDNCATRIRDVVAKSVDGKIAYDSTYIKKPESFRDLIKFYQKVDPWVDFGTHLLIGSNADSIAKISDYMFLPEHIMKIYSHTNIINHGTVRPIVQPPMEILHGTLKPEQPNPFTSPVIVFWIIFIIILAISVRGHLRKRHHRYIDQIIFLLTGIVGLIILLVWIGSAHKVLSRNYNIVWANPVNLVFAVLFFFKSKPKWFPKVSLIYGLLLLVFIIVSFLIRQEIPAAAYPIIGLLIVRLWKNKQ